MIAAHGIVNLVREMYPALLRKSDRGKFHNLASIPSAYGSSKVSDGVEGVELLEAYERGELKLDSDGEVMSAEDEESDEEEEEEESDEDDEDDAPQLVRLPDDEDEDMDEEDEEEDEEDEEEEEDDDDDDEEEEEEVDDDDEGWEYVSEDESPAPADESKKRKRDASERVDAKRILSSEDFALINRLRTAMAERAKDPRHRTSMKNASPADNDDKAEGLAYMVDADDLKAACRTGKTSKVDRMTKILEGRKEAGGFEHGGHGGGTTNLEKLRKKNYVMVRKGKTSVRNKIRKSNSDVRYDAMHRKEQYGRDRRKRRRT